MAYRLSASDYIHIRRLVVHCSLLPTG